MSRLLSLLPSAMLVVVGVIHLLPLPGVRGGAALARLYGLSPAALADPNLAILLRHRAVLFGVLGALCLWGAVDASLRRPALVAAAVSAASFVGIARAVGGYGAPVGRVVAADVLVLACVLVAAAALAFAPAARGG